MDTSISLLSIAAVSSIASCSDTSVANGGGSRPLVAVFTPPGLGSDIPGPFWLATSPNRGEINGEDGLPSRHWSASILGDVGDLGEAKGSDWLFGFRERVASWGLFGRDRGENASGGLIGRSRDCEETVSELSVRTRPVVGGLLWLHSGVDCSWVAAVRTSERLVLLPKSERSGLAIPEGRIGKLVQKG
jgi:hypothetical protein